jgi:hypothetical protein
MEQRRQLGIHKAWDVLFDKYDILNYVNKNGSFKISSREINQVKEARLMAKFDQSAQLPEIFKKNSLSILPITRGEYLIGSFQTHERIFYDPSIKPIPVEIPDLQTLDCKDLYSEASALLFAYNSGIIQHILDAEKIAFTVNGRMSSGTFDYHISSLRKKDISTHISVQNSQVEIDAGYESPDAFCICEAKNIASEELLIRQLYYPYRLWKSKIDKPIIPILLIFSNDVFHVFQYEFSDIDHYNSIILKKYLTYTFADETVLLAEIKQLWQELNPISEPRITFPQADSFERIVDLLSVLYERGLTRDEVTLQYEFDPRQTNYYISACEYLGLIERTMNYTGEREYQLTPEAYSIMKMRYKSKHIALIRKILERPVFYRCFELAISTGTIPDKSSICAVMENSNLNINDVTINRRSSTVRSWLDWIFRIAE